MACNFLALRCQLRTQLGDDSQVRHIWCTAERRLCLRGTQLLAKCPEAAGGVRCLERSRALCSNAPDGFIAVTQLFAQVASACVVLAVTAFAIGLRSPQIATKAFRCLTRRRQLRSQTGNGRLQLQRKRLSTAEQTGMLRSAHLVVACSGGALNIQRLRLCSIQAAAKACNLCVGVAKAPLHKQELALFQADSWSAATSATRYEQPAHAQLAL